MARITWQDLPADVRSRVEDVLGAPVVAHRSHPGGFSPGTADRVTCSDGRVAFVKAVHPDLNPDSPGLHRAEARVMDALPPDLPVPGWIGSIEADGWVVLLLEYVEASHPSLPWATTSFAPVLDAVLSLSDRLTPCPLQGIGTASDEARAMGNGFTSCLAEPPHDLDPWLAARLPTLADRADRALTSMDGDTLCHWDLRADNILVRPDGTVVVIDWPWALRGARWLDACLLTSEFAIEGGTPTDTDAALTRIADRCGTTTTPLVDTLVWLTGFYVHRSRIPAPPGIPTLRAHQRRSADGLTAWLRASHLA